MPIAAFGVFAALAIVMNYVLVCTWWPAAVLVHEIWFGRARGCGCCCPCVPQLKVEDGCGAMIGLGCSDPKKKKKAEATATKKAAVDDDAAALARLGRSERFFHVHYSRWITWSPPSLKGAKPVALFLAISLSGAGGLLSWRATRLEAPAEQEVFFPSDHMFTGLGDLMRDQFLTGSEDQYERGKLYVGLAGLHQPPEYTRWKPDKNRGAAVWDDQFDLSVPAAQLAFLDMCEELRTAPCGVRGCTKPPLTLVVPDTVECFMESFANHSGGASLLPKGDAFAPALQRWLDGDGDGVPGDGAQYRRDVGFVDGRLRYARVSYELTMLRSQPSAVVAEVHGKFVEFVEDFFEDAPRALGTAASAWPTTDSPAFVWMVTQQRLVSGVYQGFAICFPVAFGVLVVATGNFRVALFAILSIALVVGSLLGTCELSGWSLGTGESIAGTIVIGLAVDYTVHLGHVYTESHAHSRGDKVRDAATVMGVTVVAGGITTFGCATFMFPCQLTFFSKMATLIGGTISFSLLYSLFLFLPLCALLGPQGHVPSAAESVAMAWRAVAGGKKEAAPPPKGKDQFWETASFKAAAAEGKEKSGLTGAGVRV